MDFYEIFVRSPVNAAAAGMLTAPTGIEGDIEPAELIYLISRLTRKRKLLNAAIGIKTKAQRKNLMNKINRGVKTYRGALNGRGVDEWRRNGLAIHRLANELQHRNDLLKRDYL